MSDDGLPPVADVARPEPMVRADPSVVTLTIRRSHLYGVVGLILGTFVGMSVPNTGPPPGPSALAGLAMPEVGSDARVAVNPAGRPARGPEEAVVTLVEFTDYECPFCRSHYSETFEPLIEEYGDQISYVVMNYPLENIHPNAFQAAEAAECAFEQDRFWEYREGLYSGPLDWASLLTGASAAQLDADQFEECLSSGRMREVVEADLAAGVSAGVRGTPAFFVNGRPIQGAQPLAVFRSVINEELGFEGDAGRQ